MVTRVNGVLASGVVMIFEMDIAFYELAEYINTLSWNRPTIYYDDDDDDDDEDYTIDIFLTVLLFSLIFFRLIVMGVALLLGMYCDGID
ncbi:hypothetical protein Tco_1501781 [Tanacetum coccineum]